MPGASQVVQLGVTLFQHQRHRRNNDVFFPQQPQPQKHAALIVQKHMPHFFGFKFGNDDGNNIVRADIALQPANICQQRYGQLAIRGMNDRQGQIGFQIVPYLFDSCRVFFIRIDVNGADMVVAVVDYLGIAQCSYDRSCRRVQGDDDIVFAQLLFFYFCVFGVCQQ